MDFIADEYKTLFLQAVAHANNAPALANASLVIEPPAVLQDKGAKKRKRLVISEEEEEEQEPEQSKPKQVWDEEDSESSQSEYVPSEDDDESEDDDNDSDDFSIEEEEGNCKHCQKLELQIQMLQQQLEQAKQKLNWQL